MVWFGMIIGGRQRHGGCVGKICMVKKGVAGKIGGEYKRLWDPP